jgi:DNA-binding PadR family transcriptional regulator
MDQSAVEHFGEQSPREVYELTRRGRAELETQTTAWHKLAATIGQVLETA